MSPVWKVVAFFAQSAAVGLAIAFLIVLVRPERACAGYQWHTPRAFDQSEHSLGLPCFRL